MATILHNEQGRPAEAQACFERALAVDPEHVDTLAGLSDLHNGQGRPTEAPCNLGIDRGSESPSATAAARAQPLKKARPKRGPACCVAGGVERAIWRRDDWREILGLPGGATSDRQSMRKATSARQIVRRREKSLWKKAKSAAVEEATRRDADVQRPLDLGAHYCSTYLGTTIVGRIKVGRIPIYVGNMSHQV